MDILLLLDFGCLKGTHPKQLQHLLSTVLTDMLSVGTWIVRSLAALLVSCSAVHGEHEFCVHIAAGIVIALQKHFNSGCVSVLRRTEDATWGKLPGLLCMPDIHV
jgi:hypothetical protein